MSYESQVIRDDKDLLELLQASDYADLDVLVDIVTGAGTGRVSVASDVLLTLESAKRERYYGKDVVLLLVREIQHFGGNTMLNAVRRQGVKYETIVKDVFAHVCGGRVGEMTTDLLELRIIDALVAKAWNRQSEEERAEFAAAFCSSEQPVDLHALKAIVRANPLPRGQAALLASVSSSLFSGGVTIASVYGIKRVAMGIAGIVGLGFASQVLASEAYRVTVPCVVQITHMRQKIANDAVSG